MRQFTKYPSGSINATSNNLDTELNKLVKNKAKEIRRQTHIPGWHVDESKFPECDYSEVLDLVHKAYELGKNSVVE